MPLLADLPEFLHSHRPYNGQKSIPENRGEWFNAHQDIQPSGNRYDRDGATPKFLADAKLLAAVYSSAFECDGGLCLTAIAATAIQDHPGLRVV